MTYQIKKTVIINDETFRLGFYQDYHGDWCVDSAGDFGGIPANALTGPLGEAAQQIVNKHTAAA
jgi:hypothetical protein|tara:strand:+ start:137 stop:328 length:192 start_codon:yes stop_codon:yes gene_type:complete